MSKRRIAPPSPVESRIKSSFGKYLRDARGDRPQSLVAEALGVTRSSISNIEKGRHRVFLDQVYSAAIALEVDIADLLPPLASVAEDSVIHGDKIPPQLHPGLARVADAVRANPADEH